MTQSRAVEVSVLSKLLAIWAVIIVVVIITAIVTGSQVFWWQQNVAEREKHELRQEIVKLQQEIKILKTSLKTTTKPLINQRNTKKSNRLQTALAGRDKAVISILRSGNLAQLVDYIHPSLGLRLSPYSFVDPKKDLVFTAAQLGHISENHKYTWGYNEETGLPIKLSLPEYYQTYIYDLDYAETRAVSFFNQATSPDLITSNCSALYPRAIIVEFQAYEPDTAENNGASNWRSIRLVFEESGSSWYLVGIIHDQWSL